MRLWKKNLDVTSGNCRYTCSFIIFMTRCWKKRLSLDKRVKRSTSNTSRKWYSYFLNGYEKNQEMKQI